MNNHITVLIADDMQTDLLYLKRIIDSFGYRVVCASSGTEAIALANSERPQVIFLDIMMHEINGYDVCRMLKADPLLTDTPIIFISAKNRPVDHLWARRQGGETLVGKPYREEDIERLLQRFLPPQAADAEPPLREHCAPDSEPASKSNGATLSISTEITPERRKRCLVVDDSHLLRSHMELLLSAYGLDAEFVEDAEAALLLARSKPFDIIFLDVMLPEMDGYTACKLLKKSMPATPPVPVVLLTSKRSPFNKMHGALVGCDKYLTKPLNPSKLYSVLSDFGLTAFSPLNQHTS